MTDYRIQVVWSTDVPDGRAKAVLDDVRVLGIDDVRSVRVSDLFFVRADVSREQVDTLCHELLVDPVSAHVLRTHHKDHPIRRRQIPNRPDHHRHARGRHQRGVQLHGPGHSVYDTGGRQPDGERDLCAGRCRCGHGGAGHQQR